MENDDIICSQEQQEQRLNICKNCPSFVIKETQMTECSECECSISLLITFKFKSCPKGNWS